MQKTTNRVMLVSLAAALLFVAGCSAGISGGSDGGGTTIPDISGTAKYLSASSTCADFNPPTQCMTVTAGDAASYTIAWDSIYNGAVEVAGQSLVLSSAEFDLGNVTVGYESCEAAFTDAQLALDTLPEGEQIAFTCVNAGESCSIVLEKDSDCTNALDIYEAISFDVARTEVFDEFGASISPVPAGNLDYEDRHIQGRVCTDVSDVSIEGNIATVAYSVDISLEGMPMTLTMTFTFDLSNYQLLSMSPIVVEEVVEIDGFDVPMRITVECDPQEGSTLVDGLGGDDLHFTCSRTVELNMGGGYVEEPTFGATGLDLVFVGERGACEDLYGSCEELIAVDTAGRVGGPYPAGWSDEDIYGYYSGNGLLDNMHPYGFVSGADDPFTSCVDADNPLVGGGFALGYNDLPDFISLSVEGSALCIENAETGDALFTERCIPLSIPPFAAATCEMETELVAILPAVAPLIEEGDENYRCKLMTRTTTASILQFTCDSDGDLVPDNCTFTYKYNYDRSDIE